MQGQAMLGEGWANQHEVPESEGAGCPCCRDISSAKEKKRQAFIEDTITSLKKKS